MLLGTKPLPEPVLSQIHNAILCQKAAISQTHYFVIGDNVLTHWPLGDLNLILGM